MPVLVELDTVFERRSESVLRAQQSHETDLLIYSSSDANLFYGVLYHCPGIIRSCITVILGWRGFNYVVSSITACLSTKVSMCSLPRLPVGT